MELTDDEFKSQNIPEKPSLNVSRHGPVAVIHMGYGENRLNATFVTEMLKVFDQLERDPDVHVVVTTSSGKFYSNGIDLDFLMMLNSTDSTKAETFFNKCLHALYIRVLTFPKPTIAAISGHCFAGGMLLAMCHNYRFMNREKGWMSMNEVHINMVFSPFLLKLCEKIFPHGPVFNEILSIGKRYTGDEALRAGLVNGVCRSTEVLEKSVAHGKSLVARGPYNDNSMANLKNQIYQDVLKAAKL